MQNKYVGDIGDFGKYGLLRHLTGMAEGSSSDDSLRLGVVWYLFPDEKGKTDGKFTKYLKNPTAKDQELRDCDPKLYWVLRRLVRECNRNVFSVRMSGVLPHNTAYYGQSLIYPDRESLSSRKLQRQAWIKDALEATKEAELVFIDPDNGIAIPDKGKAIQTTGITKVAPYSKRGPKYVLMDDLLQFYNASKSLVIYHHIARRGSAKEQINKHAKKLQVYLDIPHPPWVLWYHRGTARAYFIVPQRSIEIT